MTDLTRINELATELSKLTRSMISATRLVDAASQYKGQRFDDYMFEVISTSFEDAKIITRGNTHRSGDLIINWNDINIMFEYKNYNGRVPNEEVDKAHRDLLLHKECQVLIMIASNVQIAGHETEFGISSQIYQDRFCLYLSEFTKHDDHVQYMSSIVKPIIHAIKPILKRNIIQDRRIEFALHVMPNMIRQADENLRIVKEIVEEEVIYASAKYHLEYLQRLYNVLNGEQGFDMNDFDLSEAAALVNSKDAFTTVCAGRNTCTVCNSRGHNSAGCKYKCFRCSEDNHLWYKCPKLLVLRTFELKCGICLNSNGHDPTTCPQLGNTKLSQRKCGICMTRGFDVRTHDKRNCPHK